MIPLSSFRQDFTPLHECTSQSILKKQNAVPSNIQYFAHAVKDPQGREVTEALGTSMAQSVHILVAQEHGYYWDAQRQKVVMKYGCPVTGTEPKLTRNERRKLNRLASKEKERIHREEKEQWKDLKDHIDLLHQCRNPGRKQNPEVQTVSQNWNPIFLQK